MNEIWKKIWVFRGALKKKVQEEYPNSWKEYLEKN
jgi:hypothetical protein